MPKIILIVLVILITVGLVVLGMRTFSSREPEQAGIVYWDFWDENLIRPVLTEFERTHPNIKISYISQSQLNYRTRLSTQLKEGVGPDIFPIHNSWLPLFLSDISPAPSNIFSLSDYKATFYPVAFDSFVTTNEVYAAPLGVDGLVLFVNTDILTAANVAIPTNWSEFVSSATKVTVKDSN